MDSGGVDGYNKVCFSRVLVSAIAMKNKENSAYFRSGTWCADLDCRRRDYLGIEAIVLRQLRSTRGVEEIDKSP